MEAARNAVHKITNRQGHKTDVDEVVNPAVVSETVKPHRHEETQEAVDKEVHQDHYHTTVQPIQHREQVSEKHVHNLGPQVEREYKHDNEHETQRRVQAELGQFQNTSQTASTTHSAQAAPTVTGEHVHHHVHETVQPVIHKETVQPEVVHTTVPIHETHQAGAQHHGMSALPMKSLGEFRQGGGVIDGNRHHTHEEYDGAPRPYNDKLSTTIENVLPGHHGSNTHGTTGTGLGSNTHGTTSTGLGSNTHGTTGTGLGSNTHGTTGTGLGSNTHGTTATGRGSGLGSGTRSGEHDQAGRPDSGVSGMGQHNDNNYNSTSGQSAKPSLIQKLNPKVDADGDGKAGFMK